MCTSVCHRVSGRVLSVGHGMALHGILAWREASVSSGEASLRVVQSVRNQGVPLATL